MELRNTTRTQIPVGNEEYAHQIFGKDLKVFRQTRNENWKSEQVLDIFRAFERMPGRCARLHGVELTALTEAQANRVGVGDLFLQIGGDRHANAALRKTIIRVEEVIAGKDQEPARMYRTQKVWPLSVDWAYDAWQNPTDLYNPGYPASFGHFPVLYLGLEIVNRECYEFFGNPRYDEAAAKAREFMALTECHRLAIQPDTKINVLDPEADWSNEFYHRDYNFRGAFYTFRSLLLDKTLQGFGGICNDKQDRYTPLMAAFQAKTIGAIRFSKQDGAAAIKAILDPQKGSSLVADRLQALFNPAHDRKFLCSVIERVKVMELFAQNVKRGSIEATILEDRFTANFVGWKLDLHRLSPTHIKEKLAA